MKFLVDMPLSPELAAWLRAQRHDAVHAAEIGLNHAPDIDILARAKSESRIVVTADLDYPRLLALARETDPSLIFFRDGAWSDADVIAEILRLLTTDDRSNGIGFADAGYRSTGSRRRLFRRIDARDYL